MIHRWLAALLAAALLGPASAQQTDAAYPQRPLRIVCSYAAGGGVDALARLLAQRLGERMGQQVVVENRTGGGGTIGAAAVAKAAADGYTLLVGANPEITINPGLPKKLPYDPERDLRPLVLATMVPNFISAGPKLGAADLRALVRAARQQPGASYGTPGVGSAMHVGFEAVASLAGARFSHVPYRGAVLAVNDLLGGQLDLVVTGAPPMIEHVRAGKVHPLAVMQRRRAASLPQVPTVNELLGIDAPDFLTWYAVFAPAGLPDPIARRLETEIRAVLREPEVDKLLSGSGQEVSGLAGAEFARLIAAERASYAKLIAQFKIDNE